MYKVCGTVKIIMDLSSNFIKADIILLNKLYWLLIFISCVMLTLFFSILKLLFYKAIYEGLTRFHFYVYNGYFYIHLEVDPAYVCYIC